jgi:hypothetical protein
MPKELAVKSHMLIALVIAAGLSAAAYPQDAGSPPPGQNSGSSNGGGNGQRGGRRGGMGGMGMMGRGVIGTVTEAAADHYTIKTEAGDSYVVHFDTNTRITKQPAGMRGPGAAGGNEAGGAAGGGGGMGRGGYGGNPPEQIKAGDIKVGDAIGAMGDIDATAKSVSAARIMLLDPEAAKRMQEMEANFGKTWLQGKVTAIDGTKITLTGALDNASHTAVADENTTFRKRRDPITLADIQVGDTVRVDGALKDGVFTATSISVGGMMGGGERPAGTGNAPPQ